MKANVKSSKALSDKNKSGVILSIGMIVKNEEKVLRRCLESLRPLMAAIPSELIIADTGSTDSTVEIAKEFTDNVFHFEWINDFAAARNSTLEKAKGQWFMFLDADEYLDEDVGEMVHFFNIPELRSKYKTLEIIVRSYTNEAKTEFQDGCLARLHRIDDPDDQVHFIGKIHEGIWIRRPLGYFSTILHHTGYCFSSVQQNADKKDRNLALMREEYKNNPEDIRMLSHLIDGCAFNVLEMEKYISEALELVRKNRRHLYANVIYMQSISHYQNSKPEFALSLCDEYYKGIEEIADTLVATVAISLLKAKILSALARYEESYEEFKNYIHLYNEYKNDHLVLTDSSAHPIEGLTEQEYIKYHCMAALDLKNLRRYEEAFGLLDKFDLTELKGENFKDLLGCVREICKDKKDYRQMAYYYQKIMNIDDNDKRSLALYMMESTYYSLDTTSDRMGFAKDLAESDVSGKYIDLMRLIVKQEDTEIFKRGLYQFIFGIDNWTDGYSEAIYLAVKYKLDISNEILRMRSSLFRTKIEEIAKAHDDFAGFVYDYGLPESYTSGIKKFLWLVSLYEKACYYCFTLSDEMKYEMYNRFTVLLGDYVINTYNPELLNDEDIDVLPNLHKFGYYMHIAQECYSSGDNVGYIRNMKKALINCESMREIVDFLIKRFQKTLK